MMQTGGQATYSRFPPRFYPLGESGCTVEFANEIHPDVHGKILSLVKSIDRTQPRGWVECVPAFTTVTVYFDVRDTSYLEVERELVRLIEGLPSHHLLDEKVVEIPVCYGGEYGSDLDSVAQVHKMSSEEVCRLHTSPLYTVYFLGFRPGFPYLGGLPPQIATPRHRTPRVHLPKGAVGIGGTQTGVYPFVSPGGWQWIGQTPLTLFDPEADRPCLLEPGMKVKFRAISKEEFENLLRREERAKLHKR